MPSISFIFHVPEEKFFGKIIGGNYVFCCSSGISFNPTSQLKVLCYLQSEKI